jgi:hypothetical protein
MKWGWRSSNGEQRSLPVTSTTDDAAGTGIQPWWPWSGPFPCDFRCNLLLEVMWRAGGPGGRFARVIMSKAPTMLW